ncbi:MAG: glycosyltransferase family 39 protein [bacterium]|nr:glycosyltransferase family 39 protein [bacterium]
MRLLESASVRKTIQIVLILWAGYVISLYVIHQSHNLESIPYDLPRIIKYLSLNAFLPALWGILFTITAYGLGRLFLDLIKTSSTLDNLIDDIIFSIATGFGLIGLGTFLLGSIGLLQVWLHVGLGVAIVAVTHRKILNLFRNIKTAWDTENDLSSLEKFMLVLIGAIIIWGLPSFFFPPYGFDSLNSHLPAPLKYIHDGRIIFHPEINFNNFPETVEMWFLQSLLVLPEGAGSWLMAICHLLTTLTVFAMTRRFFGRGSAMVAVIFYILIEKVFLFATMAFIDQGLTLMIVLGTYAALRYIKEPSRPVAVLVGLMLGFACGIKYSAFITVLLLGLVVIAFEIQGKRNFKRLSIDLGISTGILILVCCVWYIRNWIWFHNPLFPFYPELFPTDGGTYAQYIDDLKIDHTRMLSMFSLGDHAGIPAFFALPVLLTFDPFSPYDQQGVGVVGPWFLLTFPLIIFLRSIPRVLAAMLAIIVATYGYWYFFEHMLHLRYMMPIFSLQAAFAGMLLWNGLKPDSLEYKSPMQWVALSLILSLLITCFAGIVIPSETARKFPVLPEEKTKYYTDMINSYRVVEDMNEIAREDVGEGGDPSDVRVYGYYMEQTRWFADFTLVGNQIGYADHDSYLSHTSTARELYEWLKSYDIDYLIMNVPYANLQLNLDTALAVPDNKTNTTQGTIMPDWEQYFEVLDSYYYVYSFKLK